MALDIITSVDLGPRGGLVAKSVTATGVGFGVDIGTVVFDPLGQAILAPMAFILLPMRKNFLMPGAS